MKGEVVMNGIVQKEHGPAFLIPKEYWHQATNVSDKPCHILECQYGEECIEDDIVRQPLDENDSQ
jgi:mannose-6-phosphate isomerase-like protein (cupin superfamily)